MSKRVYTGPKPTVFLTGGIGLVRPGDEFDIPGHLLPRFDARPDITARKRPRKDKPDPATARDGNPDDNPSMTGDQATTQEVSDIPDDH